MGRRVVRVSTGLVERMLEDGWEAVDVVFPLRDAHIVDAGFIGPTLGREVIALLVECPAWVGYDDCTLATAPVIDIALRRREG